MPPPPTHAHAMTLDIDTKSMYILGGFAGDIQSRVTRIQLPSDLCNLWSGQRDKCRSVNIAKIEYKYLVIDYYLNIQLI